METTDILFSLLRHAVCGEELKETVVSACTPDMLEAVYTLSKKHDLAHLVAHALEAVELPECETLAKLKKAKMVAIYRYAKQDYELERICNTLEGAKIPFILLKGSVLRQYYPEPWMRTSCDIDVLVKKDELDKAETVLLECLHYRRDGGCAHDLSLFSPTGIHVELHFTTIEEHVSKAAQGVLNQLWLTSVPKDPESCHFMMADEMFYFYHMAHMAKHVLAGGCGIRTFLDLWIMEHCMARNETARRELLNQGNLGKFTEASVKLAQYWFSNEKPDLDVRNLECYILTGGAYGVLSNKVVLSQARTGGKLKNFLKRVFPPYELLKVQYPSLEGKRWQIPFYYIRRWYAALAGDRCHRAVQELRLNQNRSAQEQRTAEDLLNSIGLYRSKGEI